jgi:hypothetical protein
MDEVVQMILAIVFGIAVVCGFANYCNVKDNEAIIQMVKDGVDPLKASCAVKGSTELNKQICHTL